MPAHPAAGRVRRGPSWFPSRACPAGVPAAVTVGGGDAMADAALQQAIAARDKQVSGLLANPSGAVKASLADPPYAATEGETRVRACSLPCGSAAALRACAPPPAAAARACARACVRELAAAAGAPRAPRTQRKAARMASDTALTAPGRRDKA